MDFHKVIANVFGRFETEDIRYALIGGFAMAMRGVQRATHDIDLLIMLDDLERADSELSSFGYQRVFRSENVSHYLSPDFDWGRVDVLHAFRGPSLGMLKRSEILEVETGTFLRVARIDDLIGLKIQALSNDPGRADMDWTDIHLLIQAASRQGVPLDWELLNDYLMLFNLQGKLDQLMAWYGKTE